MYIAAQGLFFKSFLDPDRFLIVIFSLFKMYKIMQCYYLERMEKNGSEGQIKENEAK